MRSHLAFAGILALVAACTVDAAQDDGISFGADDGKADGAGAIPLIQSNSPFYWASSDYASYTQITAQIGQTLPLPLDDADALTTRLQGWVDTIDATVRGELERNLGEPLAAPKPIVKVLASSQTFNAWVSPVIACTGATVPGTPEDSTSQTLLTAGVTYTDAYSCVRPAFPAPSELAAFWNRANPACHLAGDFSITGSQCEQYTPPTGELSIVSTSPYIHVSTDLVQSLPEETLVVVLAHELGHYYRAHVSDAKLQRYNFWYETEVDRKQLPVPSAVATQLQTAYAEIANGPTALQPEIPGHYSARLREWILQYVAPRLAERTEPGFVCAAARDALGPWVSPLLTGYGIPSDATTSYRAFEDALAACAPRLQLTGDPSATSLAYSGILLVVREAKLPPVTLPFQGATLADVLDAMNVRATQLDDKAARLVERVRDNRIGLYTIEQEADNIALAIMVKLGMSPDRVITAWADFFGPIENAYPEEYRAEMKADHDACRAQLADDFTTVDANGDRTPVFVPIGDLSEPHHSDCYRLFNFWSEQQRHGYQPTTTLTFKPGWDALQAHARELTDAARANGL